MLNTKKKLSRDVLWNIASLSILGVSGIALNSIIIAACGTEALGVFNQVFAIYIVVSQFAVGGVHYSVLKYCSHSPNDIEQCVVTTVSALPLVSVIGLAICTLLFLSAVKIGSWVESYKVTTGIYLVLPGLFFFALNKVLIMLLNGLRHMRSFAIFQALRYLLILGGVLGIIGAGSSDEKLPLSLSIAELVIFLALISYIHIVVFKLTRLPLSTLKQWLFKHISFGSRGFLSGVLAELNTRVDVIMLGYFSTDYHVGVYSFAATFAEGFAQLNTVIRQNIDPIIGRSFTEKRDKSIAEFIQKIRKTFFPIMVLFGFLAVGIFPLIVKVLTVDLDWWSTTQVFTILVFGIVLSSLYRPFMGILMQGGRPGSYTMLCVLTVCGNLFLNSLLIPVFGICGAAWATSLMLFLEAILLVVLLRRLFDLPIY